MFLCKVFLTAFIVGVFFMIGGAAADADGAENFGLICIGVASVILAINILKAIWTI